MQYIIQKHEGYLTDMFFMFNADKKCQITMHGEYTLQAIGRLCTLTSNTELAKMPLDLDFKRFSDRLATRSHSVGDIARRPLSSCSPSHPVSSSTSPSRPQTVSSPSRSSSMATLMRAHVPERPVTASQREGDVPQWPQGAAGSLERSPSSP